MSGGELCLGICMMDWEQGICLGCGRSQEEIDGGADETEQSESAAAGSSTASGQLSGQEEA